MLSVVIATTGKRQELEDLLSSLRPSKNCEFTLVNNSQANISTPKHIAVIQETKTGLSHARNTGWQHAKGEYVAYIDDDAVADKDWVKNILAFIVKHPKVEAFGGPYRRHAKVPIPAWLPPDYGQKLYPRGVKPLVVGQEFLNGTNMIFKKSLLEKIGGFNPAYGMVGNRLNYGEETELQLRLARAGVEIWWDESIKVSHLLHQRKINLWWLIKEAFITGRATQRMMSEFSDVFTKAKKQPKSNMTPLVRYTSSQRLVKLIQLFSYALGRIYGIIVA